ncbi:MAG: hypothetical protein K2H30_02450 [Clostridia bacterium]|nr:hypothetical protein [Clostridia bacterium]MDE7265615.1 hypothetical protein [Clostridia bacterium]
MSFISFYSYKGGSGRTTTTLNTLFYLIREKMPKPERPIIIIDADTESYGMSMLLKDAEKSYSARKSLQGLAINAQQDTFVCNGDPENWKSYTNLHEYFVPVGHYFTKDIENDAVLLLRSDVTPAEQELEFSKVFALNKNDDGGKLNREKANLCEALDVMYACECIVVFDTPSGTQDMADLSLSKSGSIVCCMRPSVQFELGTRACFEKLMQKWKRTKDEKYIIFCPSAVPFKDISIDSDVYPEHYKNTLFKRFREEMNAKADDTHGVVNLLWDMQEGTVPGIPEVDRFKWRECCLGKIASDKEDERLAKEKYGKLANLLSRLNDIKEY